MTPLAALTEIVEDLEMRLAALADALAVDAPFLVQTAEQMRRTDTSLDVYSARLSDIGRRYRVMLDGLQDVVDELQHLRESGTLDATVRLGIASLVEPDPSQEITRPLGEDEQ